MKRLLYLRTDIVSQELTSGGSVAHTLGVLQGFKQAGWQIEFASSCMHAPVERVLQKACIRLENPECLGWLRWKLNSFVSTFFFFFTIKKRVSVVGVDYIYQRYSLLNATGSLLAWQYKKPLLLEFNGSEVWLIKQWGRQKKIGNLLWLIECVERYVLKSAYRIIVVSEVLREDLLTRYHLKAEKILVNPNGVDVQAFSPEAVCANTTAEVECF